MNEHELTAKLREKYVEEVTANRQGRTVEEALQEALDNTTPARAGHPNYSKRYEFEDNSEPEWI